MPGKSDNQSPLQNTKISDFFLRSPAGSSNWNSTKKGRQIMNGEKENGALAPNSFARTIKNSQPGLRERENSTVQQDLLKVKDEPLEEEWKITEEPSEDKEASLASLKPEEASVPVIHSVPDTAIRISKLRKRAESVYFDAWLENAKKAKKKAKKVAEVKRKLISVTHLSNDNASPMVSIPNSALSDSISSAVDSLMEKLTVDSITTTVASLMEKVTVTLLEPEAVEEQLNENEQFKVVEDHLSLDVGIVSQTEESKDKSPSNTKLVKKRKVSSNVATNEHKTKRQKRAQTNDGGIVDEVIEDIW